MLKNKFLEKIHIHRRIVPKAEMNSSWSTQAGKGVELYIVLGNDMSQNVSYETTFFRILFNCLCN